LLHGLWLPLVTPFRDGALDEASLRRLVRHYAAGPVNGLILAATSGEGLTLSLTELERIVTLARAESRRAHALFADRSGIIRQRYTWDAATRWMRRRPGRSTAT
jgi:dihydrodipicolinate synthase/N-acetylneuraminate lyase